MNTSPLARYSLNMAGSHGWNTRWWWLGFYSHRSTNTRCVSASNIEPHMIQPISIMLRSVLACLPHNSNLCQSSDGWSTRTRIDSFHSWEMSWPSLVTDQLYLSFVYVFAFMLLFQVTRVEVVNEDFNMKYWLFWHQSEFREMPVEIEHWHQGNSDCKGSTF